MSPVIQNCEARKKSLQAGCVPVDDAEGDGLRFTLTPSPSPLLGEGSLDSILQQSIDFAVGVDEAEGAAVAGELPDRSVDGFGGHVRIEALQGSVQTRTQHHFDRGLAPQRAVGAKGLVEAVGRFPAEVGQQTDGGLFDEGVF
jgi:hypothetical protein